MSTVQKVPYAKCLEVSFKISDQELFFFSKMIMQGSRPIKRVIVIKANCLLKYSVSEFMYGLAYIDYIKRTSQMFQHLKEIEIVT